MPASLRSFGLQGLATLWPKSECFHSLEGLFQPPTLLGFALQSFSPVKVIDGAFQLHLSALALFYKTFQLCTGASTAYSHFTSRAPLCASQRIRLGRGQLLS